MDKATFFNNFFFVNKVIALFYNKFVIPNEGRANCGHMTWSHDSMLGGQRLLQIKKTSFLGSMSQ